MNLHEYQGKHCLPSTAAGIQGYAVDTPEAARLPT